MVSRTVRVCKEVLDMFDTANQISYYDKQKKLVSDAAMLISEHSDKDIEIVRISYMIVKLTDPTLTQLDYNKNEQNLKNIARRRVNKYINKQEKK
jgi:hypothetical protein